MRVYATHIDAVIHAPFLNRRAGLTVMTRRTGTKIPRAQTLIGLTVPTRGVVDGEGDDRTSRGFGAADELFGDGPGRSRIELKPGRAAVCPILLPRRWRWSRRGLVIF